MVTTLSAVCGARGRTEVGRAVVDAAHRWVPQSEAVLVCFHDPTLGGITTAAASGLISPEFSYGVAPDGVGLWGAVQRTKLPVRTGSYFADTSFRHEVDLDDACRVDGVASGVAVPFVDDGEAFGALFVFGRSEEQFSDDDVVALAELIRVATPAVQRAIEMSQQRAELEERTRCRDDAVRSARAFDGLLRRVSNGAAPQDIAEYLVAHVTSAQAALLVDAAAREIARWPATADADPTRDRWVLNGIAEVVDSGDTATHSGTGGQVRVFAPAMSGDRVVGVVLVVAPGELGESDREVVRRAADLFALLHRMDAAAGDGPAVGRGEAFQSLAAARGPVDPAVRRRARDAGIDAEVPVVLAVTDELSRAATDRVRRAVADEFPRAVVEPVNGLLLMVSPSADAQHIAEAFSGAIERSAVRTPLVSAALCHRPVDGEFAECFARVGRSLELLRRLGRGHGAFDVSALPPYLGLFDGTSVAQVERFVDTELGGLLDADSRYSFDLLNTMTTYFRAGQNMAAAAKSLGVHPNTVVKRLRRVADLLGDDWQSDERVVAIRIAVDLHELIFDDR